jgi:creatine kinase
MFARSLNSWRLAVAGTAAAGVGLVGGIGAQPAHSASTSEQIKAISDRIAAIESDLGISGDVMDNYPVIRPEMRSLMAKNMTPAIYRKYAGKATASGFTFDQAIQAGLDAPHLGVGIAAGDEESYETFKDIFDLVIEGWHGYPADGAHQLDTNPDNLKMTPEQVAKFNEYVISTRIRAGRSIRGLPLPPGTNRAQRRKVEEVISNGLKQMKGDLAGTYYPLGDMTKEQEQQLQDDHFLFQKPSPRNVLANCGAARDWPDARGIFHNDEKTFLVWVNEEDHMRCISMQKGGDVKAVFSRWARAINDVEVAVKAQGYEYMYNDHLGNICCCPSNLGTGLRASVMLKLPKLYEKLGLEQLEELCQTKDLQARGFRGEHSPPGPGGAFDISNMQRIGFSEVQLIQKMIDGCDELIEMEKKL